MQDDHIDASAPVPVATGMSDLPEASWSPVLSGEVARRALDTVDVLSQHVTGGLPGEVQDPTLSGGLAGLATLYASLAQNGVEDAEALAVKCLDDAIDILATSTMGPSFYSGFTGVAWAAELVDRVLDQWLRASTKWRAVTVNGRTGGPVPISSTLGGRSIPTATQTSALHMASRV
jgi:hypothetical protein